VGIGMRMNEFGEDMVGFEELGILRVNYEITFCSKCFMHLFVT
jgi:hypothetical protein